VTRLRNEVNEEPILRSRGAGADARANFMVRLIIESAELAS
jgi:hypothetical protein